MLAHVPRMHLYQRKAPAQKEFNQYWDATNANTGMIRLVKPISYQGDQFQK